MRIQILLLTIINAFAAFNLKNEEQRLAPYTVVRLDRDSPFAYSKNYSIIVAEPITNQNAISKAVLDPEDAFSVQLTCSTGTDPALCIKVEQALKSAGKMLLDNLIITRQVVLKASYQTFCAGQALSTCANRDVVPKRLI